MEEEQVPNPMVLCQVIDSKEEHIIDKKGDFFDPLISISNLNVLKVKILEYSREGEDKCHLHEFGLLEYFLS